MTIVLNCQIVKKSKKDTCVDVLYRLPNLHVRSLLYHLVTEVTTTVMAWQTRTRVTPATGSTLKVSYTDYGV